MSTNTVPNTILIDRLTRAVWLREPRGVVERVRAELAELARREALEIPDAWRRPQPDTYARRLLHRDPARRFTVIVMTWAPGQGTPIHDHGGLWCVECVVQGRIEAEPFDVVEERDEGVIRFASLGVTLDDVGATGAMLPAEYHRMRNPSSSETAVTVHVYGGELERCHAFVLCADGYHCREVRHLSYTE